VRYDRRAVERDARSPGADRLRLLAALTAGVGLALAALESSAQLGWSGPLPWGALLVPVGLALALLAPADDGAPPLRARALWSVLVAALVLLHQRPTILTIHWGVDTWPTLASGWQLVILAALSALILPGPRWGDAPARRVSEPAPEASSSRRPAARAALAAALGALTVGAAWMLRSNVDLGDSWYVLEVAADGRDRLVLFPRWPLTSATLGAAYRLSHPMLSARDTVAFVSCLAGGLAAVVGLSLLRRMYPGDGRWLAAAFLFTTYGVARPFLGYIEVYPFAVLALLVFLWAGVGALEDRPLWRTGLAGGLAVVTYVPLVLPVGAALLALLVRRLRARALSIRTIGATALAGALPPALVYGWLWVRDIHGRTTGFVPTLIESLNLDWADSWLIFVPARRLFAPEHALNVLNQWLLMDAVGLALVVWGMASGLCRTGPPAASLLLAALAPTFVYTFVMNPYLPPAEDWDLFAHGSVLTALLGPLWLIDRLRRRERWYRSLAIALLAVNLAHTVPGVLAAHFAPTPEIRYPDVFAVEAFFRRAGLRYAITDRSTHVYLRTLLRDRDVRSVQFADGTLGPEGAGLDLTATGAFVLVPETERGLRSNLLALGASHQVTTLGGYRVHHGFIPPPVASVWRGPANWRLSASENAAGVPRMADGDPGTRWSSVVPQREGLAIEVDLSETVRLAGARVVHGRCCPWDYPRGLAVAVADQPGRWRDVLVVDEVIPRVTGRLRVEDGRYRFAPEARPDAITLRFPATPVRWVRLTALRADSRPWSITELELLRFEP
jgi:hypothetical protein